MVKINFDHFQIAEININHDKLIKSDGNLIIVTYQHTLPKFQNKLMYDPNNINSNKFGRLILHN